MNLRKDHSHASNSITVNNPCEFVGEGGDRIEPLMQKLVGGGSGREALSAHCDSLSRLSGTITIVSLHKDLDPTFFLKWISTLFTYNFQRRMSRLEQR